MHEIGVLDQGHTPGGGDLGCATVSDEPGGDLPLEFITQLLHQCFCLITQNAVIECRQLGPVSKRRTDHGEKLINVETPQNAVRVVPPSYRPSWLHTRISVDG
jgi:hypothetical protein